MPESSKLDKAVGRLIIGRLPGPELDEDSAAMLGAGIISGVTLFKENAVSLPQLLRLTAAIHKSYDGAPLVAVDQEGGAVQRFDHLLTPLPSPMALAARGNLAAVSDITALSCRQLKLAGVNCLLAPTVDIASNPRNPVIGTRSFSSQPETVAALGLAVAIAIKRAGLLAVAKHFPGHGDTLEDSHTHLAVNHADAGKLWRRELMPFRTCATDPALAAAQAVMVGHIWVPAIDREPLPASLSPRVIGGLLRGYLKFDGLVVTDDLLMKAVTDRWGLAEAAVMAVAAGAEQLLALGSAQEARECHRAIAKAVKAGRIGESWLAGAAARIGKARLALARDPRLDAGSPARLDDLAGELEQSLAGGRALALETSELSVSILRGSAPRLAGEWVVLAPDHGRYRLNLAGELSRLLSRPGALDNVRITNKRYPLNPSPAECRALADFCQDKAVIYLTFRLLAHEGQAELGRLLCETSHERVTVACDVPYDLIGLPAWHNCMATHDPSDLAMEALAILLVNNRQPLGSCPVTLQFEII